MRTCFQEWNLASSSENLLPGVENPAQGLEPPWVSWCVLGLPECLGASLGSPVAPGNVLGASWGFLGASWSLLGSPGAPGSLLGASWVFVGLYGISWAFLGLLRASWKFFLA